MITLPKISIKKREGFSIPYSAERDATAEYLLLAQIIGATFFQKIAIPLGGGEEFFFGYFLMLGLTAYGFLSKRLEIRALNLWFVMVMCFGMSVSQLLGNSSPSLLSFLPLLLGHVHYAFCLKNGMIRPGIQFEFFQKIMLIIGVLGIAQYFLQFVIGMNWAFFMDTMFPKDFYKKGFNGLNEISYGSTIIKSNGVFFLEPSMLSQFMALAIIIELLYFNNLKRLAVYILTIAVTFSGTGIIMLFAVVPFLILKKKKFFLFFALTILFVSAPIWAPYVGLEKQIERATEITDERTSGYARFISMVPFIRDNILPETDTFLFGRGSGSIPWDDGFVLKVDYEIFNPSWAKLMFEYGVIGSLFYMIFILYIFKSSKVSGFIKVGLFVQFILLGEYIIPPTVHGIIIGLLVWPSIDSLEKFNQSIKDRSEKVPS